MLDKEKGFDWGEEWVFDSVISEPLPVKSFLYSGDTVVFTVPESEQQLYKTVSVSENFSLQMLNYYITLRQVM